MRDEDDTYQQETVHTEVFKLLPQGPHGLLSLAVTKNLRISDPDVQCCVQYIFRIVNFTLVIKFEPSAAAILIQWHELFFISFLPAPVLVLLQI